MKRSGMIFLGGQAFYIGRKAPKGYEELPGAIHLGKNIWIIPIRKEPNDQTKET